MKKVSRSIFLIALLVMMSAFSITAHAEPEEEGTAVTLDYQLAGYNSFKFYISESDNEIGTELLGGSAETICSGSTKLDSKKVYYLHVVTKSVGSFCRFIGKFQLNGDGLEFSNKTTTLATNLTDFKFSYTGFGKEYGNIAHTANTLTTPSSLMPAIYLIFDKNWDQQIYISAVIKPVQSVLSAQATGIDDKVNITWNAIDNAASYSVERSATAGGPYTTIASDLTETSYTDKSVTANTTYYYIVKANLSDTETVTSSEVSGTPTTETPTVDSKLKVVLEPEEKLQLSVDDHLDENTNMTWTSSDSTVAQVDANGVVTAIKAGNAVIHVQSPDGNYSDNINILVVDNADDYRLAVDLKVGKTSRLTVDDLTNTLNVTWDSSDTAVATVSSKGVVTAKGKGLTLAKATDRDGNVVGQVYVRVRE
ncbi:Ig-like domain-containing protein [Lacrimispora sp.]|uniref:Ig-like domain-containing protein n=1 Tax=Lacrimispora sp. TaxID=2719234 RepID=UPI0028B26723|nr:Ig-like domain-containing protein [Lacrimispora sp.]